MTRPALRLAAAGVLGAVAFIGICWVARAVAFSLEVGTP